jgi:hypothetical protein
VRPHDLPVAPRVRGLPASVVSSVRTPATHGVLPQGTASSLGHVVDPARRALPAHPAACASRRGRGLTVDRCWGAAGKCAKSCTKLLRCIARWIRRRPLCRPAGTSNAAQHGAASGGSRSLARCPRVRAVLDADPQSHGHSCPHGASAGNASTLASWRKGGDSGSTPRDADATGAARARAEFVDAEGQ